MNELLTQEEIEALFADLPLSELDFQALNIEELRYRLNLINGRFAYVLREQVFHFIHGIATVSFHEPQVLSNEDCLWWVSAAMGSQNFYLSSANESILVTIETELVVHLVARFFGGHASRNINFDRRELTAVEQRIAQLLLNMIIEGYKQVWPMDIKPSDFCVETHLNMINMSRPSEMVVTSSFHLQFDDVGGNFHITMPYSMFGLLTEPSNFSDG